MMTRTDYFTQLRVALLELDDRTLGVYLWHCAGPFTIFSIPSTPLSTLEIHDRMFPIMDQEFANQKVGGTPNPTSLRRLAAASSAALSVLKGNALMRYENTVLAIGQRARDILQGDSTALWNVAEERRRQLNAEWSRQNEWATQAEQTATTYRQHADTTRVQLDATLAELERLAQIKQS